MESVNPDASNATGTAVSDVAGSPAGPTQELMMARPMMWTPGTYVLVNRRGGTAMSLDPANDKSIVGHPMHGGWDQQWEFVPSGLGFAIRCKRTSGSGKDLYLTVDEGGVRNSVPVVASGYPVAWKVEETEEGVRIGWPNTKFVFDLANWGASAAGTKIQLRELIPGELCQLWRSTKATK